MKDVKFILRYFIYTTFLFNLSACGVQEKPQGIVKLATIPGDAQLSIDGVLKGNSPTDDQQFFTISLSEGKHTIDAFLTVNEELDKIASKSIIVADQTEQVVTLTMQDRLTELGKVKKAERDAEEAKKQEALAKKVKEEVAKVEKAKKLAQARIPPSHDGAFIFDTANYKWVQLKYISSSKTEGRGTIYLTDICVDDAEAKKKIPYIPLKNVGEIIVKGEKYYRNLSIHNAFDTSKPGTNREGPCFHRNRKLNIKSYSQASKLQKNTRKFEIALKSEVDQKHIAIWLDDSHRFYVQVSK